MDKIFEFVNGFNIQTMVSLVLIVWYFNRHTEQKIEVLASEIRDQARRTDKIYEVIVEMLKAKGKK